MKNSISISKQLRVIEVKYLGPTMHRGSRVKLVDERMGQSKTLGYDYGDGDAKTQAWNWLNKNGFNPKIWGTRHSDIIIMCDDWKNFHELKDF